MRFKAVTYSSFATSGVQPMELESILRVSQRNNARDAITGVLMFNGAVFVQTIEGEVDPIDRLLMQIGNDSRHCQMEIRDERPTIRRIFPDWTMGYVRLDGGWLEGQHDIVEALAHEMPREIHDILLSLATTLPFG